MYLGYFQRICLVPRKVITGFHRFFLLLSTQLWGYIVENGKENVFSHILGYYSLSASKHPRYSRTRNSITGIAISSVIFYDYYFYPSHSFFPHFMIQEVTTFRDFWFQRRIMKCGDHEFRGLFLE